ncbi:hypothetical protein HDV05_000348 [Chytridiales sp. JEL 0842]|nr:hypothetical protein HDV05_000348 [Chytridiales sp. JEL 0842]
MTDKDRRSKSPSSSSPDRKRSLEDEYSSGSDNEDTRGGRFKRQALGRTDEDAAGGKKSPERRGRSTSRDGGRGAEKDAKVEAGEKGEEEVQNKTISMRAIVTLKEAGIVIGKSGTNAAEIRDQSGARLSISDNIPNGLERVMTLTGALDTVAKAFSLVAYKLAEEAQSSLEVKQRHTQVRLLVPHIRMGSIIGKTGSKIKEIQDASGARLHATEELLPNSTERMVTINGVVDSIHIATYHIGHVLQDAERAAGTVYYRPIPGVSTANMSSPSSRGSGGGHGHSVGPPPGVVGGPPYPPPGMMGMPAGMMPPQAAAAGYGYMPMPHPGHPHHPAMAGRPPMHPGMMPPGGQILQQIYIPSDMVGAIIGKGGSKINEVRMQSGCQIKIGDPTPDATERLVSVTGTQEGTQMALYLLYQRLESEKARMASQGRG